MHARQVLVDWNLSQINSNVSQESTFPLHKVFISRQDICHHFSWHTRLDRTRLASRLHVQILMVASCPDVAGAAAEGAAVEEQVRGAPGSGAAASGRQAGAAKSAEGQPRAGRCVSHSCLYTYQGRLSWQQEFKWYCARQHVAFVFQMTPKQGFHLLDSLSILHYLSLFEEMHFFWSMISVFTLWTTRQEVVRPRLCFPPLHNMCRVQ